MKKTRFLFLLCLVSALLAVSVCALADVVINEVMATNGVFENGRHDDWVELKNTGTAKVSLKGWYLSDSKNDLHKWAFPDKTSIAKGGFLVVYCTDESGFTDGPKNALYAGFKIGSGGETLYLTDPEGTTTSVKFGKQFGNVTSGIPSGGTGWMYLEEATPGKENAAAGYSGQAGMPVFELSGGCYPGEVTVALSSAPGTEIRYTLDCSAPTRNSPVYTGPITVKKTTVIRACACSETLLLSPVAGNTYFINDVNPVPVFSVYTDDAYLFSNAKGLMVKGSGKTANYNKNLEYPLQFEYFDENGVRQFGQMGTVRISGHSSRSGKQKSLAIFARAAYGSKTFAYPFFENREYTEYSSILLRCTNSDYKSCRLRDAVFGEMSDGLGLYYQAGKPVVVYINGEYYGHFNLREKANKDSLAQWEGITDETVIDGCDILEGTGMNDFQVIRGSNADWVELMNYCKKNNLKDPERLQYVLDRIDVDSMFSYVIFNSLIGNYDVGNVRVYRFPGGKWTFMLHDIEAGCMHGDERPVPSFLRSRTSKSSNFAHWALAALLELPEYRDQFLRRTAQIIESNFLYDTQVSPIFDRWVGTLREILPRHLKKFRHFPIGDWETNVNAVRYYARTRPKNVINTICSKLKVTNTEKQEYFGQTLQLLEEHNVIRKK